MFDRSPLRFLRANLPPNFRSHEDRAREGITSAGTEGWIRFDVYETDDADLTAGMAVTLVMTDSLGRVSRISAALSSSPSAG